MNHIQSSRFFVAIAIVAGCSQLTPATAKPDSLAADSSWTGFGHDRGWKSDLNVTDKPVLTLDWNVEVGEGYAQVIGSGSRIFVASGSARKIEGTKSRQIETLLTARSIDTGKKVWTYKSTSTMTNDQETFGGVTPTPRATPLLIGGRLVYWTFTGELICLNAETGTLCWRKEPVLDWEAQRVQFGFSASPVACPDDSGDLVVLAAGKRGGLVRLSAATGDVKWVSPSATFSYATPVFAKLGGVGQWIVVSRDDVIGVDQETGKQLWSVELKEKGLTNVPTPLLLDASSIVISGQGMKGTQCVKIRRSGARWTTEERWANRIQFFYTNWLKLGDATVLGCTDKFLTAFDCGNGNQLGRWRGYGDGNLLQLGDHYALVSGRGDLSVMSFNPATNELVVERKHKIGRGRFWAAPSVIGERLFVRFGKQLHCYQFAKKQTENTIENRVLGGDPPRLAFARMVGPDPVEAIFSEFEKNGQQAALTLYSKLRQQKKLSAEHRIAIAESAWEQGMKPLAAMIMQHAKADFPDSKTIREKIAEWSK